ncbi:glycosyl transferase [Scenedesmus sp. NREL 46B-D3]|nr:glycosyl transferase [Scenedesmus sp. NREL 46B-D3]
MVQTRGQRSVFVTVGTTKFEDLIKAVDTPEFAASLAAKGYTQLIIQKGTGEYVPCKLVPAGSTSAQLASGIKVEYFDFSPSLAEYISSSALIISHAGSGSIFETLHAGKPLIVVPNPLLMDNHQAELGDHLAAMQAVVCAAPDQLLTAVSNLDTAKLKPFPAKDACGIIDKMDDFMGRHRAAR